MQLYQNPAILLESLCLCEIVAVASGLLFNSQVADSKYSKSYKGNCKANHLENKLCGGPITVQKLWRKCSIKLEPQWKEYHLNPSSGVLLLFLPFMTCLIFFLFFLPRKYVWVSIQHLHMHIHMFLWCFTPGSVLRLSMERHGHIFYLI